MSNNLFNKYKQMKLDETAKDDSKLVLSNIKKALFDLTKYGFKTTSKDANTVKFLKDLEMKLDAIRKEIHDFK